MKKVLVVNGAEYHSLEDVPVGVRDGFAVVYAAFDLEDLPERVYLGVGVLNAMTVPRDTFAAIIRELAKASKLPAIKWVSETTGWHLRESKYFVDGLLET